MRQVLPRPQRSTPVKGTPPRQPRRRRRLRRPQLRRRNRTRRRRSHHHRPHQWRTRRQHGRRTRRWGRNNGDRHRRGCRWGWGSRAGTTRQHRKQNTRERTFPRTRHGRRWASGYRCGDRPAPGAPTDRRRERTNRTKSQAEHPNPTTAEDTPQRGRPGTIRSRRPRSVRGTEPTPEGERTATVGGSGQSPQMLHLDAPPTFSTA